MSSSSEELDMSFVDYVESLRIPYEEIKLATNNFTDANLLPIQSPSSSSFQKLIYKGQLKQSGGQLIDVVARKIPEEQDNIVFNELLTSYLLTHKNILPIFKISGIDNPIIINKYEANESLDKHLSDSNLTWMQRLHICVGVAHALSYIHDYDAEGGFSVIHGNIKSSKILLDENWEPKLNCFGFSMFVKKHQPHLASKYSGTIQYTDPAVNTGCLTHKSDVYSFGVVLFEVLFGRTASVKDGDNWYFARSARLSYEEKILGDMIDPDLLKQMNLQSLENFSETAYYCLEEKSSRRPNMAQIVKKLEASLELQQNSDLMNFESNTDDTPMKVSIIVDHAPTAPETELRMASFVTECKHLEIQLEDIISATNNFDESKVIGRGGFGKVYAGELSHSQSGEKSLVAIKRLDRRYGQGDPEFFKEIRMLSCYRHENLISLLGFCCQEGEMILIYEHASRGSLDRYLSSPDLSWTQRLRICVDAAKGLSFLHDPNGTQQRVLHCDIKSANILLDNNMTAKVSDFGLSKMGPAYQQYSLLITSPVGTPGYCDPLFMKTYSLTKESDVYSFGVVLFEVLSGKLCVEYSKGQIKVIHVPTWKQSYKENKLNEIIMQDLIQQMDLSSLKTFSDIAFQCLRKAREERPTMYRVVQELEIALESQEFPDLRLELLTKHEDILMAVDPRLIYKTGNQLKELLSKGLIIEGKTWFSLNEKGQHCHMISMQDCLIPNQDSTPLYKSHSRSRFPAGLYQTNKKGFTTHVRTQLLSPSITYTVNLVYCGPSIVEQLYIDLKYRLRGEATTSVVYLANKSDDDSLHMVELYQFTSDGSIVDLEIIFENSGTDIDGVEGIMFQPLEKVEDQLLEDDRVEDIESISDSDTYWEQKIPNDYEETLKLSKVSLEWTTKKELYSILCKGFLLDNGQQWFSIDKNGKKCQMLSARAAASVREKNWESSNESRFGEVLVITRIYKFDIQWRIEPQEVSCETTYAAYLVFKLPQDQSTFEAPIQVYDANAAYGSRYSFIYLVSPPHTPVIGTKFDENTYNPLNRYKRTGIPQQRSDGWMEVKVWQFQTTTKSVPMNLRFEHPIKKDLKGLMIQGIELRPI